MSAPAGALDNGRMRDPRRDKRGWAGDREHTAQWITFPHVNMLRTLLWGMSGYCYKGRHKWNGQVRECPSFVR